MTYFTTPCVYATFAYFGGSVGLFLFVPLYSIEIGRKLELDFPYSANLPFFREGITGMTAKKPPETT
jgi:hypothetical protein